MNTRGQAASSPFGAATRAVMPEDDVVRLLLLRHGEVAGFEQRIVRGQIDLALSERGREQHERLAHWLVAHAAKVDLVFTSDLVRCRDLGERVARASGAPLAVVPALREQSMGAWEGLPWDEVSRREGAAINAYWNDYFHAAPPGGESMEALFARVAAWWHAHRASFRGKTVAIATHIGPLRAFLCELLARPGTEALRFAPAIASCSEVLVSTPGAVVNTLGERPWLAGESAPAHTPAVRATHERCIALSGSAGTGKTTLARALAVRLDVPYIEEGMRRRLEAGLDLHTLDADGMRRLNRSMWEEQKAECEHAAARHGGYVADRSHIDFAAFWLHYGLHDDAAATERMLTETRAAAQDQFVVLLPHGVLPLVHDGVRSTNPWMQLRFQLLVEGLLERHQPAERFLRLRGAASVAARVEHVLDCIGR
jgi:broad specificity phosphatase PhoE/nicotinamide riboside kinase